MQMGIKQLLEAKNLSYLSFLYSAAITALLLMPVPKDTSISIPFFDKLAHISVFAVFGLLWFLVAFKKGQAQKIVWVFTLLTFYGIVIETFQGLFVISRNFDLLDILANTLGLLLGMAIYFLIKKRSWL